MSRTIISEPDAGYLSTDAMLNLSNVGVVNIDADADPYSLAGLALARVNRIAKLANLVSNATGDALQPDDYWLLFGSLAEEAGALLEVLQARVGEKALSQVNIDSKTGNV